jgi:hypothetical protein
MRPEVPHAHQRNPPEYYTNKQTIMLLQKAAIAWHAAFQTGFS